MNTVIKKILKNTSRPNKRSDMSKIDIDFQSTKELINRTICFDVQKNNLQREYLISLLERVEPNSSINTDYLSLVDYICSVIKVVINAAPLEAKFRGINICKSLEIINRIHRILTGRTYYTYTNFKFKKHKIAEALNFDWDDDF